MAYGQVRISKTRRGPGKTVRLLVDTGSGYSILPARTLEKLGVKPEWREEFELANGEPMFRNVGRMHIHHRSRSVETLVIFGNPGDATVLGAYSLEGLRLEVDPYSGRVRAKRKFLAVTATVA
ncbi:MAG: aspartyl protease family protein [Candidatus Thermoplasmatota archaeon]